jgi:small subunit ribosomal protein S20
MAITKSAKKAHRQSLVKKSFNDSRKQTMKRSLGVLSDAISAKDKSTAQSKLSLAFKALDKAAKRGVIKKGTADRKKSRLAQAIAKIA